jgi:hypothetical protein
MIILLNDFSHPKNLSTELLIFLPTLGIGGRRGLITYHS